MVGTRENSPSKSVSLWRDGRAGLQGDRVGIGRCEFACCLEQASLPLSYFLFRFCLRLECLRIVFLFRRICAGCAGQDAKVPTKQAFALSIATIRWAHRGSRHVITVKLKIFTSAPAMAAGALEMI